MNFQDVRPPQEHEPVAARRLEAGSGRGAGLLRSPPLPRSAVSAGWAEGWRGLACVCPAARRVPAAAHRPLNTSGARQAVWTGRGQCNLPGCPRLARTDTAPDPGASWRGGHSACSRRVGPGVWGRGAVPTRSHTPGPSIPGSAEPLGAFGGRVGISLTRLKPPLLGGGWWGSVLGRSRGRGRPAQAEPRGGRRGRGAPLGVESQARGCD